MLLNLGLKDLENCMYLHFNSKTRMPLNRSCHLNVISLCRGIVTAHVEKHITKIKKAHLSRPGGFSFIAFHFTALAESPTP